MAAVLVRTKWAGWAPQDKDPWDERDIRRQLGLPAAPTTRNRIRPGPAQPAWAWTPSRTRSRPGTHTRRRASNTRLARMLTDVRTKPFPGLPPALQKVVRQRSKAFVKMMAARAVVPDDGVSWETSGDDNDVWSAPATGAPSGVTSVANIGIGMGSSSEGSEEEGSSGSSGEGGSSGSRGNDASSGTSGGDGGGSKTEGGTSSSSGEGSEGSASDGHGRGRETVSNTYRSQPPSDDSGSSVSDSDHGTPAGDGTQGVKDKEVAAAVAMANTNFLRDKRNLYYAAQGAPKESPHKKAPSKPRDVGS
jgi:hypothetical protein